MTKKKVFIILASVLLTVAVLSVAIPISRMFFRPYGRQEVPDAEHAIQIARAAIIQRYGEAEIEGMKFFASDSHLRYWSVREDCRQNGFMLSMGYPPIVYVRRSDGMVILLWRNNARTRILVERVMFG